MSFVNNTTTIITVTTVSPTTIFLYTFSILIAFSILCYIFVFYHFLFTPTIRRALNNHVIFLLLGTYCVQTVFDTPLHLDYFRRGFYWPPSLSYCFILFMLDYITYEIGVLLLVWAAIERHFFVFNPTMFNTRIRRAIYHYIPLGFCFVYPITYYTYFILFYPCNSYYDMNTLSCVAACYLWTNNIMAYYELIMNGFVPVCMVAIFSVALLVRVLWKKQQMGRQMTWRKNRKMTVQLLGVSTMFLVFNVGYFVLALGQMVWDPNFGANLMVWFLSVNVCAPQLVCPFLCLSILPDLKQKFKALNPLRHRMVVEPISLRFGTITNRTGRNMPTNRPL
jgi:hypothetical protein